jgi:hypothetical protein
MKKLLLIFCFFFGSLFAQEKSTAKIITELVIGADGVGKPEYLFDYPGFVETDYNLNIYVAEKKALTVRVYDRYGKFLRNIGRRGRGPGEFLDITLMKINNRSEIIVFDNLTYRITFFSTEGKYLKELKYNPSLINWPRGIVQLDDGNYLLSYYLENEDNLFFLWDKDFNKRLCVITEEQVNEEKTERIEKIFKNFDGNCFDSFDNKIIISKYFYDGHIYLFDYSKGNVQQMYTISGYKFNKEPYTPINDKSSDAKSDLRLLAMNTSFKANINNLSLGVFFLNNHNIINFIKFVKGKEIIFGFEKYDKEFNFLGFWTIQKSKIENDNRKMLLFGVKVAHKDKDDNFYLIDETEYPKVKRIRIE